MEPIPVGAIVDYHGSIRSYHGRYEVTQHNPMDVVKQLRPDIGYRKGDDTDAFLAESYPDGVSYDLWPVGVPKKFGEREKALYGARRESITQVQSGNDWFFEGLGGNDPEVQ